MIRILVLHGEEGNLNVWQKTIDQLVTDADEAEQVDIGVLTEDQRETLLECTASHKEDLINDKGLADEKEIQEIDDYLKEIETVETLLGLKG
jgi:hypothetical protein